MENFVYFYQFVSVDTSECPDSVCVKNIEDANKKISSLAIVITEFDAISEYNYRVVILL